MKRIASVAVMAGDRLLIGKRSDDQRWNLPGGHVDEGESPAAGAARELHEETGIAVSPDKLLPIAQQQVTTFTGKQIEVNSYLLLLPDVVDTKREGTDPGEAHDWSWTDVSSGLPVDIASNWHNKTDSTMAALGLVVQNNGALDKSELVPDDYLEKAWPREYNRVKGQDKEKGVASKRQYRYMQAMAAQGDADAKAYLANSPKGGEGLPDSGTGGARGERESNRKKGKGSDRAEKADDRYEETTAANIKRMNRPKLVSFAQQVAGIKAKYAEKKPKPFAEQVKEVKARYKSPVQKSADLFYGKLEGLLEKGYHNEELLGQLMDAELIFRNQGSEDRLVELYKSADRLFDATMSPEEQTVYELSYMAKDGCEVSLETLERFAIDMYEELLKNTPIEAAVAEMVKSNYGPKQIGNEKVSLYNDTDNINRKANRTGVVHENVGQNRAEQKYTPSVQGTFAQQATREAKRDQQRSAKNPVKVYTDEEKAKLQAQYASRIKKGEKLEDLIDEHERLVGVLESPSHKDDKREAKVQTKELEEYKDKASKSEDNSRVVGKRNGASVRKVHGYLRYTSGPKRGEYVHRHEAEKRLGRKLGSKEHVDHTTGNRGSTKNTKVMSAGAHAAKTNKTRANGKGYSGGKRYEHTRD